MVDKSEKIAVLGAGTMGAGIAQVAAQAGFETLVYDVKQEFIDTGLNRVKSFLKGSRERGKLSAEQEKQILDRFTTSTNLEDCKGTALVIEAAPEKLDLKRDQHALNRFLRLEFFKDHADVGDVVDKDEAVGLADLIL